MKLSLSVLLPSLALAIAPCHGATITGADTFNVSTSFTTSDSLVTLFAYQSTAPLTAGTFNTGNTNFIGVGNLGNQNAINDVDGDPGTGGDQEAIDIALSPTVSLSEIEFNFSRADGTLATDGIQIASFTSDPGAVASGGSFQDLRWDSGTNSIYFELSGSDFSNGPQTLTFSDLSASAGQTLRITANDSDQGGSQAAITRIEYIPEPSAALLGLLGCLSLLLRRR